MVVGSTPCATVTVPSPSEPSPAAPSLVHPTSRVVVAATTARTCHGRRVEPGSGYQIGDMVTAFLGE